MIPPFARFLEEHRAEVYRFLASLVAPDEVDDCFQETFLSALRAYPTLRHGSNLRAWVLQIAHRKALDAHRQRSRRPTTGGVIPEAPVEDGQGPADGDLWRAVRSLPPRQRTAVAYRFVSDLGYRVIARLMGCSEAAARQNVHEGVRRLREVWNQ